VNTSIPTKTGKRLAFYRSPTRDYQELKQQFGLAHYEWRGWQGLYHHAILCIAAYEFLTAERLNHRRAKKSSAPAEILAFHDNYISCGSRAGTTPRG
jgi:SRSO17 transposase